MTTPEQVCSEQGIDLVYFDGRGSSNKGLYNQPHNLIAVDTYLYDPLPAKRRTRNDG